MINDLKLDDIDWKIIELLAADGRISFSAVGRAVGLSAPAAAERVRRLEEAGVINGYHAQIDPRLLGYGVQVYIEAKVPAQRYRFFKKTVAEIGAVQECHHITGQAAFLLRVWLKKVADLEPILGRLSRFGETSSTIVLSTVVEKQPFVPSASFSTHPPLER